MRSALGVGRALRPGHGKSPGKVFRSIYRVGHLAFCKRRKLGINLLIAVPDLIQLSLSGGVCQNHRRIPLPLHGISKLFQPL